MTPLLEPRESDPGQDKGQANSHRKVKKGAKLSFYLSPYNNPLNGGSDWCQGAASVLIESAPNSGTKGGKLIGTLDFRFYGKP